MPIKSRKPTGVIPWPFVLLEGEEKAGKSFGIAAFTASPKVGRCFWIDLAEGSADEYGAMPGASYEVIEHDGTFGSVLEQVLEVKAYAEQQAAAGEPPVVLIIDSMTAVWDGLKDWASARAARSEANRKKLRDDPAAEIKVSMNLWNDAGARYRRLMTALLTFSGIVLVTARGKEVAEMDASGRPMEGRKVWKVEGHKTLAYDATAWIRLTREDGATLEGARSLSCGVRPGKDRAKSLPPDWTLEWFIFEALGLDASRAHVRDLQNFDGGVDLPEGVAYVSPAQMLELVKAAWDDLDTIRRLYGEAGVRGLLDSPVDGPDGKTVLGELIANRGRLLESLDDTKVTGDTLGELPRAAEGPQDTPPVPEAPEAENGPEAPAQEPQQPQEPTVPAEPSPRELFLERLDAAATIDDFRAAWKYAGTAGYRELEVNDPVYGQIRVGQLIMKRQAALAAAPPADGPDPRAAAAGELNRDQQQGDDVPAGSNPW